MQISNLVKEAETSLKKGYLNDFGKLLHESWLEKKSLSSFITNTFIEDTYDEAINQGALGGKLLGAGGGGFFLFYVPHHKQKYFLKNFNKLITIPFKFTSEGSSIIFRKIDN